MKKRKNTLKETGLNCAGEGKFNISVIGTRVVSKRSDFQETCLSGVWEAYKQTKK